MERQQFQGAGFAYRPDIDGLRAVAVTVVLLYHFFPDFAPGGFVGVDVFFVISGFLITGLILQQVGKQKFSLGSFYARRIRRLFPTLLLVLGACLAAGYFLLVPQEYSQVGSHVVAGLAFCQNFQLWGENGYFDVASELKPLVHLWSLAIEEQFYFFYPVLLLLLLKLRKGSASLILFATLLISFLLNLYSTNVDPVFAFFWPLTRMWELLFGGGLAFFVFLQAPLPRWVSRARAIRGLTDYLSVTGLALVFVAVFFFSKRNPFPGWRALLPVMGAAACILAGPSAWLNRKVLARSEIVFVGLISYPLYLWHWPIISFAHILSDSQPIGVGIRLILLFLSFCLAVASYLFLEKSFRRADYYGSLKLTVLGSLSLVVAVAASNVNSSLNATYQGAKYTGLLQNVFGRGSSWDHQKECWDRYKFTRRSYCLIHEPAKPPTVALIGDSHANHYYWGMAEALAKQNENLIHFGSGGCIPFFDTRPTAPGYGSCQEIINAGLKFALTAPSIHTLAIAARLPAYLSAKGTIERGSKLDEDAVLDGLLDLADRVQKARKNLVVILDNPEMPFDPKACTDVRPFALGLKHLRNPCAVAQTQEEERQSKFRSLVKKAKTTYPDIAVFDPLSCLCDGKLCYAEVGGKILYADSHHLNMSGSAYVASYLSGLAALYLMRLSEAKYNR